MAEIETQESITSIQLRLRKITELELGSAALGLHTRYGMEKLRLSQKLEALKVQLRLN